MGLSAHLGAALSKNGITFVGYDQRGHGKSEGEKGFLDNSKEIMNDGKNFIKEVVNLYPNVPIFFIGRGMGGLVALATYGTGEFKVSGIVLMSPSLKKPTNSLASSISNFALKLMPDSMGLFNINFAQGTRNPSVVEFL